MPDFLLLMHGDTTAAEDPAAWAGYLDRLAAAGMLRGGSIVGDGIACRQDTPPLPVTRSIVGYMKVAVADIDEAARLCLAGNPTFVAGGTVEIRELPESD